MARSEPKLRTVTVLVGLFSFWAILPMHAPSAQRLHADGVAWMLLVDDLHLAFANTGRLRTLLRAILNDVVQPGDLAAIRTTGPSTVLTDFSTRRELLTAIKGLTGGGLRPADIVAGTATGHREVRYRTRTSLSLAISAMALLGQVDSPRRALLYISDGYPFDVSAFIEGRALAQTASINGVKVFAVDGRSLDDRTRTFALADPAWQEYMTVTRSSLRIIAEQSGGFAIFDGEDVPAALQRISDSMR